MLTRFKSHAKALSEQLSGAADHVLLLYGDNTDQENAEIERKLPQIPDDETVVLVATGQKIRMINEILNISVVFKCSGDNQLLGEAERVAKNRT